MSEAESLLMKRESAMLARWRRRIAYQGALLGVVCAVVALSLLEVDRHTQAAIAQRRMEDRLASLAQVMPPRWYDNNPLRDVIRVSDAAMGARPVQVYPARRQGVLTAVAFQVVTEGYGGPITLIMGVDRAGVILGVRVLSHKETPGLADKIEIAKSSWITHFNGMSLLNTPPAGWAVKKDGGQIDQFTGATITPRAMVKGIHAGMLFFARHREQFIQTGRSSS